MNEFSDGSSSGFNPDSADFTSKEPEAPSAWQLLDRKSLCFPFNAHKCSLFSLCRTFWRVFTAARTAFLETPARWRWRLLLIHRQPRPSTGGSKLWPSRSVSLHVASLWLRPPIKSLDRKKNLPSSWSLKCQILKLKLYINLYFIT